MKKNFIYSIMITMATFLVACDENEIMPSFTTVGTATQTMADIVASTSAPLPSETLTLTISYVNPSVDPLTEIVIHAKVGAGDYVEVQKYSVASEEKDTMITKTFTYEAPATAATSVVFDMVITSQKPYPQVQRAAIKTK